MINMPLLQYWPEVFLKFASYGRRNVSFSSHPRSVRLTYPCVVCHYYTSGLCL